MLTFNRFPICYFEMDEGAVGGGSAAAEATVPPEAGAGEGGTTEGTARAGEAEKPVEAAGEQPSDGAATAERKNRANERIRQLIEENKRLRAEAEAKTGDKTPQTQQKATGEAPAQPTGKQDGTHPALLDRYGRPLEPDDDGLVLDGKTGMMVTPEFLVDRFEATEGRNTLAQELAEIKAQLQARERQETEREYNARVQKGMDELADAMETAITTMREEAFPQLPKEKAGLLDEYLMVQSDALLTAAISEGNELSDKLFETVGRQALAKAKYLFGTLGVAQIQDNKTYSETHPIKTGGTAGVHAQKPVDERNLTPAQRDEANRQRAARAMTASDF